MEMALKWVGLVLYITTTHTHIDSDFSMHGIHNLFITHVKTEECGR